MDRHRADGRAATFSWVRFVVVVVAAAAIVLIGAWVSRTYPISGYRAGYDAATAQGPEWIRGQVEGAGETAMPVCTGLRNQSERSALTSHYDETFLKGCAEAVDRLYGKHVPWIR